VDDRRLANLLGVTALAAVDRLKPPVDGEAGHGGGAAGALVHLHAWPGESVEGLRRVLGISQPATVRTVNRLVADGLLERRPGPDRRTAALVLTGAGRTAAERVLEARGAALQGLLEPLDEDERARLLPLLERLAGSLAQDRGGAVRVCRLCDRGACCGTAPCPLGHTVPA
jgi:MarR family transcriptional repressor of emrRAB